MAKNIAPSDDLTIEHGRGATYSNTKFTVYRHSVFPRSSVLAGRARREWVDDFDTLEEARTKFPQARVLTGSTFREDPMHDLPDDEG